MTNEMKKLIAVAEINELARTQKTLDQLAEMTEKWRAAGAYTKGTT